LLKKDEAFMTLGDLGEFGFIHRFAPLFYPNIPGVEGIGDDCAVIPFHDHLSYLATTDLLIENTHFIKTLISPHDLGYKSLAVNLSDIAAMGGKPQYAFLSLGLPIDTPITWSDEFFSGLKQLANETGVFLLGGDTTRSNQVVINIFLLGMMETYLIKRRSQAIPGDIICCTGYLGDSGGGLKILLEGLELNDHSRSLIQAHIHPYPYLEEGAWLAAQPGVHAMIDISDGLASDIQRVMEASHCGAHLEVERLPLSVQLQHASQLFGWSAENLALTAGEDYCLLTTIDPKYASSVCEAYQERFKQPLFQIGTILPTPSLLYTYHKKIYKPIGEGFDHFKKI
jgi:thiamine-monophosphate kinase